MENTNTFDFLMVVQCEDVVAHYGKNATASEPTALDPTYAQILTSTANGSLVQGQNIQMAVPFSAGQQYSLNWRACSLSLNFDYQCVLSDLTITSTGSECVASAKRQSSSGVIYVTTPADTQKFVTKQETDYLFSCGIEAAGTANYTMSLDILDHDGNRCGLYQLGGTITIVQA